MARDFRTADEIFPKEVALRTFVHATESEEKVLRALSSLVDPRGYRSSRLKGHFGNPIQLIELRLRDERVRQLCERLRSLPEEDLELGKKREGNVLYVRFDKQEACQGRLKVSEGSDVIHVKLVFPDEQKAREFVERLRGS